MMVVIKSIKLNVSASIDKLFVVMHLRNILEEMQKWNRFCLQWTTGNPPHRQRTTVQYNLTDWKTNWHYQHIWIRETYIMFTKWRCTICITRRIRPQRSHNRKRVYRTSAVTEAENKEKCLFEVRETYGHTDAGPQLSLLTTLRLQSIETDRAENVKLKLLNQVKNKGTVGITRVTLRLRQSDRTTRDHELTQQGSWMMSKILIHVFQNTQNYPPFKLGASVLVSNFKL